MRLKKDQWYDEKTGDIVCPHSPFPITILTENTNPYLKRQYCAGCKQLVDGYGMVLHLEEFR